VTGRLVSHGVQRSGLYEHGKEPIELSITLEAPVRSGRDANQPGRLRHAKDGLLSIAPEELA
jgi:hypothetical protein